MSDSKRPGKRERLVTAAQELVYRQGVARTTLAHIAEAADVPVGNVYYYFKTKDDIVGAVGQTLPRITCTVDADPIGLGAAAIPWHGTTRCTGPGGRPSRRLPGQRGSHQCTGTTGADESSVPAARKVDRQSGRKPS